MFMPRTSPMFMTRQQRAPVLFVDVVLNCARFAKSNRIEKRIEGKGKMKKAGFLLGTIAVALVAWAVSFKALAAGNAKQEITDLEHKCIAATTADQAMA